MTNFPFDENEFFKAGKEVWFEMRGPEVAQKAMEEAGQHEMTRDLRQYLFEHCFGAVWNRPGLERAFLGDSPFRGVEGAEVEVETETGPAESICEHEREGEEGGTEVQGPGKVLGAN